MTLADSALDLARSGWPVLPLHGKVPCTLHGLRDASMDAEQVHQWWKRYPGANIGARMPESLFVVDLDPRAGAWESLARLEDEHDRLPVTLTVRTGGADRALDRGRPHKVAVNDSLDMLEDWISVIAGFGECGILIGSQQN